MATLINASRKYYWDWGGWSLNRRISANGSQALFALRCDCGRFTFGCSDHWFCGFCKRCQDELEGGLWLR